jgi:NTP pyrophosphatase (non-canonical NTP hydrolase)
MPLYRLVDKSPEQGTPGRGAAAATLVRLMDLSQLQTTMRDTYGVRDAERGRDATFRWFIEEVGELARALRRDDRANLEHEFSDALAWLASLANLEAVDLDEIMARYANGCPKCGTRPCGCPPR